jgi:RNA recognition motif-containing protein
LLLSSDGTYLLAVIGDKPRGFAFISFSNALDAQDAIDNYDMNELPGHEGKGKYLKVNLARPDTKISGPKGDQAGELLLLFISSRDDGELTDCTWHGKQYGLRKNGYKNTQSRSTSLVVRVFRQHYRLVDRTRMWPWNRAVRVESAVAASRRARPVY